MSCTLRTFHSFERLLKSICKKYPQSATAIQNEIEGLATSPEQGFVYPGFNPFQVRKFRIGLKAYRLSSARGLRLIFLHLPNKAIVAPLVIYKKGHPGAEHEVKKMVLAALKDILKELELES